VAREQNQKGDKIGEHQTTGLRTNTADGGTEKIDQNSILCKMQSEQNSITANKQRRFGIGVIFAIFLVGIGLFAFIGHESLSTSLNRSRRSTVVEMEYSPSGFNTDRSDEEDSLDAGPDGPLSPLEPGLPSNAVLRHHAVHTEVNTRINLQDFMRAAAEKAAAMRASTASSTSEADDDSTTNEEFDDQESEDEELPDFDVCPIMPELPGESGSIRKVREIERQNVQRRVSEKLEMFNETQIGCTADCHVGCPEGTYRLPGMVECKPRLNCDQIRNLTKGRNLIGGGGVKRIYTADLQGSSVVIARVKRFKFNQYLDSMVELQQTGIVAQLIGMCEEPAWPEVVLQYHSLGSLLTVSQLPDVLSLRWRIIMSYLDVVEKLHNRVPRSPRVLCDASRTEITLSQFLLTDDFRVVLNDVDELIAAGADGKVRCNCNIIRGGSEFDENGEPNGGCLVPPEQKQCGTNIYYTEKIDIWKIPDITRAIIGDSTEGLSVWDELHRLHQECKNSNPNMRPPIEYVVDKYKQLQYKMQIPSYH